MVLTSQAILLVLGLGFFLWIVILTFWVYRIWRHYNKLISGTGGTNLSNTLENMLSQIKKLNDALVKLEFKTETLKEKSRIFIQKIKLARYNPFKDVGGDQSFILALLDEDKNGIVISSLHSRETTRWFAKKISKGQGSKHQLSPEEEKVINAK